MVDIYILDCSSYFIIDAASDAAIEWWKKNVNESIDNFFPFYVSDRGYVGDIIHCAINDGLSCSIDGKILCVKNWYIE